MLLLTLIHTMIGLACWMAKQKPFWQEVSVEFPILRWLLGSVGLFVILTSCLILLRCCLNFEAYNFGLWVVFFINEDMCKTQGSYITLKSTLFLYLYIV